MPRASTLLAWADVRVGFPSDLMRVVAPSAPSTAFCATVVIVWRGLTGADLGGGGGGGPRGPAPPPPPMDTHIP